MRKDPTQPRILGKENQKRQLLHQSCTSLLNIASSEGCLAAQASCARRRNATTPAQWLCLSAARATLLNDTMPSALRKNSLHLAVPSQNCYMLCYATG